MMIDTMKKTFTKNNVVGRDAVVAIYAEFSAKNRFITERWQQKIKEEELLKEHALARAEKAERRLMELEKKHTAEAQIRMENELKCKERDEIKMFEFEEVCLFEFNSKCILQRFRSLELFSAFNFFMFVSFATFDYP